MLRAVPTMSRGAFEKTKRSVIVSVAFASLGCAPARSSEAPALSAPSTATSSVTASTGAPSTATAATVAPFRVAPPVATTPDAHASGVGLELPEGRGVTNEALDESDGLVRGRSTVLVDAPLDLVRARVLDFNHYAEFMPFYQASRVLDRTPTQTKVYMQVAALGGLVKMNAELWFPKKASVEGGWEAYASAFDGGNVDTFKATWRLRPLDPAHTWLSLEVFLLPKLPLPKSTLNDENLKGARNGVTAMRERSEAP